MGLRTYLAALIAIGLCFAAAPGVRAASDDALGPEGAPTSRIPLLDESDLEKFSSPSASDAERTTVDEEFPPNTLIPLETNNLRYFSYFAKVKHRISQSHYYPKEAVTDLLNGIVTVSIGIRRDGSLDEVKVIGSSGKEILDETARDIIRRAAPFPTVPTRITHTPLKVSTELRFVPTQDAIQRQDGLGLAIPMK